MNVQRLANMVIDLSVHTNRHPSLILKDLAKLLYPDQDQIAQNMILAVYAHLEGIRETIPWDLTKPCCCTLDATGPCPLHGNKIEGLLHMINGQQDELARLKAAMARMAQALTKIAAIREIKQEMEQEVGHPLTQSALAGALRIARQALSGSRPTLDGASSMKPKLHPIVDPRGL